MCKRKAAFRLGTKAETLRLIQGNLKKAAVLPQYSFTVGEWEDDAEQIQENFSKLDWNSRVIVRSSSLNEDTDQKSQAGKYKSVADVSGIDAFRQAVNSVISSYDDNNRDNQVLVQPMLTDVKLCGVAFTLDPNTLGNYYVINYTENGSTDAITSGTGEHNRLYYRFKGEDECSQYIGDMQQLITALMELEELFGQDNLDVEFAFCGKEQEQLYILQVRALCVGSERIDRDSQHKTLKLIADRIDAGQSKKPFVCGKKAVYSVMTDWNPAEMIGVRPKQLAMSIYREIVTDSIWAYQRDNYGYRNLRSFPLMVDFCGLPYIDVRVSFNSFVPAQLDERISEKLVNYYLDRLTENPHKHDKAEFEIVFSCYTLDLPERIGILSQYGFTQDEIDQIIEALRDVTNHIIDFHKGLWRKDYAKLYRLEQRYKEIAESSLSDLDKVYWLLEDCKRYGTLPFAGLARGAFIAVQLLQSMVTCGILSQSDYELYMRGINTVSSNMAIDKKQMSKRSFIEKYGHLRPGTYDITSLRYDEASDMYFDWNDQDMAVEDSEDLFRISLEQLNRLKDKLVENGLANDVLELLDFIRTVIAGREYGKFAFTRNLSKALSLIQDIGEREGFSREDCAFVNIQAIRELYTSTKDVRESLEASIEQGKAAYRMTQGITLPPFIANSMDVWGFYYPDSEPNYITSGKVIAEICFLDDTIQADTMPGKIVLIPSADPGYDWIFSHDIRGFVTMYGGANSHMAIRAGELGIPAVVGVGAKEFERCKNAGKIEIDCMAKYIRVLKS